MVTARSVAQGKTIDPAKIVKTDDYARSHPRFTLRNLIVSKVMLPLIQVGTAAYPWRPFARHLSIRHILRPLPCEHCFVLALCRLYGYVDYLFWVASGIKVCWPGRTHTRSRTRTHTHAQGRRGVFYASNYAPAGNGHDLSCVSGLVCAHAIGAEYPFNENAAAKRCARQHRRIEACRRTHTRIRCSVRLVRLSHRDFERLRHFMGCYHADPSYPTAPWLASGAVVVGALVQSALRDLLL
jgi:hypothetical protein